MFLGHSGAGTGAQAWSFGLAVKGASVASVTVAGTRADSVEKGGFRLDGFEKTERIDAAKNQGRQGIVSAVVLSLIDDLRLPPNALHHVAKLEVDFTIPAVSGTAHLEFEDGLQGSGRPVKIAVTQDGVTKVPLLFPRSVELHQLDDCCQAPVAIGFSEVPIRGAPPFEGILEPGPLCAAGEGSIRHFTENGPLPVYVNIISNLDPPSGVQGWSFGFRIQGDCDVLSATTAGTAADLKENGGLWNMGFNKTELINFPVQLGVKGAVTGVVLSLTEGTTLPPVGTETVLALRVSGPEGGSSTLRIFDGLRGSGQPVASVITVDGGSRRACNMTSARLFIEHIHGDDSHRFIRGNANGDLRFDIADPIWIVNELYLEGPPSQCPDDSDSNDDGIVDASDVVYLIEYLFRAGSSPPTPFLECGADPTPDETDCFAPSLECA